MKTDFVLYKHNSSTPIIVDENSNPELLQRCQDNWYHKLDIKYILNEKGVFELDPDYLKNNNPEPDFLFLHIPKTGGISFKFNVIYNPYLTKKIAIYHKINIPHKEKSELNIFNEDRKMFTLLRNPTNTVISAYYHFKHLLKIDFEKFCEQVKNMQIKFLLGYDIGSAYNVTNDDLNKVKQLIDEGKLTVGVYKGNKMDGIYNLLELPLDKVDNYVLNKNVQYNYRDVAGNVKQHVRKVNTFDNLLYDYVTKP